MRDVVRKFMKDPDFIYIVSNGIVFKQRVTEIIREGGNWVKRLMHTKGNVGWCDLDHALIVYDGEFIHRVDRNMLDVMLKDESVEIINDSKDSILEVKYNPAMYTDAWLKADGLYKDNFPSVIGPAYISRINACDNCKVISFNKSSIYSVYDNTLICINMREYMQIFGCMWEDILGNTDEHTGHLLNTDDSALLISANKIERISYGRANDLLSDSETHISKMNFGVNSYMQAEYNMEKFTDKYLRATTDYRK